MILAWASPFNLTFLTILIWYKTEMEVARYYFTFIIVVNERPVIITNKPCKIYFLFRKKYLILLMLPMSLLSLLKLLLVERKYELKFTQNYQIYIDLK